MAISRISEGSTKEYSKIQGFFVHRYNGKQTVTVLHSLDTAVQIVLRNPFSSLMAAVQLAFKIVTNIGNQIKSNQINFI